MRDATHLALAVRHDVVSLALAVGGGAHPLFAEIDIAVEFAHDHQVDRARHLGPQRAVRFQPRKYLGRTQIGEQAQLLAHAQHCLFGAQMPLQPVACRIAHRTEQDRIAFPHQRQRLGRQRMAMYAPGGCAHQPVMQFHLRQIERAQHAHRLGHDFGADAVTGKNGNFHGVILSVVEARIASARAFPQHCFAWDEVNPPCAAPDQ